MLFSPVIGADTSLACSSEMSDKQADRPFFTPTEGSVRIWGQATETVDGSID